MHGRRLSYHIDRLDRAFYLLSQRKAFWSSYFNLHFYLVNVRHIKKQASMLIAWGGSETCAAV
ncbi:hypothetical protein CUMW_141060, partial [Citrus unshiu]